MEDVGLQFLFLTVILFGLYYFVYSSTISGAEGSVGLPVAYLLTMFFLHIGFLSYLVPDYSPVRMGGSDYLASYQFTDKTVFLGTLASAMGVLGLAIGVKLFNIVSSKQAPAKARGDWPLSPMFPLGIVSFLGFVVAYVNVSGPLLQAFRQSAQNISITFVCLGAFVALHFKRGRGYRKWMALAMAWPIAYLVMFGFISYGFTAAIIFLSFWMAKLKPGNFKGLPLVLACCLALYTALSAFIGYMTFREELRTTLWHSDSNVVEKLEAVVEALGYAHPLGADMFPDLDIINTRLNQNIFVGKVIEWHDRNPWLRLNGSTLMYIPVSWVPRFLWPGKPEQGGSAFLAENTGMKFSAGTTFAAGPVVENYVNFGYPGVFFGFIIFGYILRWIDVMALRGLRSNKLIDFATWFSIGISFIAPLSDLFFMVNTAIAIFLIMKGVAQYSRHPLARSGAEVLDRQS